MIWPARILQLPTQARRAFADTAQATAAPSFGAHGWRIEAYAVIYHIQPNGQWGEVQIDGHMRGRGVFAHVVKSLLGDPIEVLLDGDGQAPFPLHAEMGL